MLRVGTTRVKIKTHGCFVKDGWFRLVRGLNVKLYQLYRNLPIAFRIQTCCTATSRGVGNAPRRVDDGDDGRWFSRRHGSSDARVASPGSPRALRGGGGGGGGGCCGEKEPLLVGSDGYVSRRRVWAALQRRQPRGEAVQAQLVWTHPPAARLEGCLVPSGFVNR